MTSGPQVEWDWVKGEMKMMWTCWGTKRGGQQQEWGLGGKGVKVDLQWRQIAKLREPSQELSFLEGCHPHITGGQIREICGVAKEILRVVSRAAIRAGEVIGPAYGVVVGLEPRVVARKELREGVTVGPEQQFFGWVNWRGGGHKHLVERLRLDNLLYHLAY